jgi:hypothetical protein
LSIVADAEGLTESAVWIENEAVYKHVSVAWIIHTMSNPVAIDVIYIRVVVTIVGIFLGPPHVTELCLQRPMLRINLPACFFLLHPPSPLPDPTPCHIQ